jgi:DNA-binding Xre family transcriptional regulator
VTKLGNFLDKKSVNKSEISRRTGLRKSRLSELSTNEKAKLRADEIYLIAIAIDVDPCEVLKEVCGHLKINN